MGVSRLLCSACGKHPPVAAGTSGYDGKHPWDGPVCYGCSFVPGGTDEKKKSAFEAQVRAIASAIRGA